MGHFDKNQRFGLDVETIRAEAAYRATDFLNGKKTMDANRLIAALAEYIQHLEGRIAELEMRTLED